MMRKMAIMITYHLLMEGYKFTWSKSKGKDNAMEEKLEKGPSKS